MMLRPCLASACDYFSLMATGPLWLPCDAYAVDLGREGIVRYEIEYIEKWAKSVSVREWVRRI